MRNIPLIFTAWSSVFCVGCESPRVGSEMNREADSVLHWIHDEALAGGRIAFNDLRFESSRVGEAPVLRFSGQVSTRVPPDLAKDPEFPFVNSIFTLVDSGVAPREHLAS